MSAGQVTGEAAYAAAVRHCLSAARGWRRLGQEHCVAANRIMARIYLAQWRHARRMARRR